MLMLFLGRIAGISSIFWSALTPADQLWRWLFLLGLPLGAWLGKVLFAAVPSSAPSNNMVLAVVAGLLVGFGVKMGSGCTSGHGVCGIGRFSIRSIVATLVFISSGVLTVVIVNLLGGAL
ncbi:UNVERIFIED_CONTAM: hypothetical protein GTU68_039530 [Idotea baltica]|nr:hypothetical protein [Idotea baltica]